MARGQSLEVFFLRSDWPFSIDNFFLLSLLFSSRSVGDRFQLRLIFLQLPRTPPQAMCRRADQASPESYPPIKDLHFVRFDASVEGKREIYPGDNMARGKIQNTADNYIHFKDYRLRAEKSVKEYWTCEFDMQDKFENIFIGYKLQHYN